MINVSALKSRGTVYGPAAANTIDAVVNAFPTTPPDMVDLWRVCDGFYLDNGLTIYNADNIAERNTTYEREENASDYVLIGDDSGGRGILLLTTQKNSPVFICDLGFLDADYMKRIGENITQWIDQGCPIE